MFAMDRRRVAFLFVIEIVGAVFAAVNLVLVSKIVNEAVGVFQGSQSFNVMFMWITFFALLSFFNSFLWPMFMLQEEKIRLELEDVLLHDLQGKTQRLRMEAFERSDFQDILNRAKTVAEPGYLLNVTYDFFHILRSGLSVISISVIVLWWSPWLFIAIALTALPTPIVKLLEVRKLFGLEKARMPQLRLLNYLATIMSSRESAKEVRTFGMKNWLLARWRELFWRVENERFQVALRNSTKYVSAYSFGVLGVAGGILWCVVSVMTGGLNAGRFSAMLLALQSISAGVQEVFNRFGDLAGRLLWLDDFFLYLQLEPEEKTELGLLKPEENTYLINHVSFCYPQSKIDALKDVSIKIHTGEKVALVGENGSGKTTLVKLLTGLYLPTEGEIQYGGVPLEQMEQVFLRQKMAVIFQDFNQYALSVKENIGFGQVDRLHDQALIEQAAMQSGASRMIHELPNGYETLLTKKFSDGTDLSGGQWQSLAIARSYIRKSNLVFLDEPTAALDPKAESEVLTRFLELSKNKTAFVVSHRLGLARHCDRIIVMKDGRIAEQGTHEELVALNGEYAHLWAVQSQWYA
jgi:ABC-type multidrug transport system fused ATPase/permease subunit